MKKNLIITAAVLFLSVFFRLSAEGPDESEAVAEKIAARDEKIESAKIKAEQKFRANAVADEYTNMLYMNVKKTEMRGNFLSVSAADQTFNIYAKNGKGAEIPLLSSVNDKPVKLFARVGKTVFDLNGSPAVKRQIRQTSDGAQLVFTAEKLFQTAVDLKFVSSKAGIDEDGVMISVYTTNLSGKDRNITLRMIFDTVLGENTPAHFTAYDGRKINNECRLTSDDLKKARYLLSSDGDASVQFMLSGNGISEIQNVTCGNPGILEKLEWDENINRRRSFNSIQSYNNSVVSVEWPEYFIEPKQTVYSRFFIFASVDEENCHGLFYTDGVQDDEKSEKRTVTKSSLQPEADTAAVNQNREKVEFNVPQVKEYQLDPQYIQNLIDKIDSLQSDSKNVNKAEINRLNAELDAIFNTLRQQ